jgi:Bacterial PH domain
MQFKVKKNPLLVGLILCLIPIIFSIPVISLIQGEGILVNFLVFIFVSPLIFVLAWALIHSYHELTETEFISTFGFIKINIPFHEIKTVCFSNNPVSSPAWTFKRLKIEYKQYGFALLSLPKEEEVFLKEMKKHCPNAIIKNRQGKEVSTN